MSLIQTNVYDNDDDDNGYGDDSGVLKKKPKMNVHIIIREPMIKRFTNYIDIRYMYKYGLYLRTVNSTADIRELNFKTRKNLIYIVPIPISPTLNEALMSVDKCINRLNLYSVSPLQFD